MAGAAHCGGSFRKDAVTRVRKRRTVLTPPAAAPWGYIHGTRKMGVRNSGPKVLDRVGCIASRAPRNLIPFRRISGHPLLYTDVKRGYIVVFRPIDIRQTQVKRAVGIPGDRFASQTSPRSLFVGIRFTSQLPQFATET